MKFFSNLRTVALVAGAFLFAGAPAKAQSFFGLSATVSTNSIGVSNSVIYTINVTNFTGSSLTNTLVTNTLSGSVQFVSASNIYGSVTTNDNVAVFDLGTFADGGIAQLTLTLQPVSVGLLTNFIIVTSTQLTNTAATNVVLQVTNTVTLADLGVTISGPAQTVVTNDLMNYGVSVTNFGPSVVANVMLTNTLPPGVILESVSPTNQTYSVASSNLIFNLGTLTNNGYADLQFTVQPTNAGALAFSASVGAAGILDTNFTNNFASTNITIISYLPGMLVAFTNSGQSTNFQNGLLEQSITVSNAGLNDVPAARVVVTALTNRLFNAVGTNNGNPFVIYGTTLAAGQSVNLLLQYFPRKSFPFTNAQLNAFAVPVPNWTPPAATATSTNLNITRIVTLANGNKLIEWPAITNRTYTVVYSDNVLFSNALIAPPSIVAPANQVQWIDYGPPATLSAPTNSSLRFYRVFMNP